MLSGQATAEGTKRFRERRPTLPASHFRDVQGLIASSIGLGTYLGDAEDATDALQRTAVAECLANGVNVIDCAINYRHMRSERSVGAALAELVARRVVHRDEVIVATKGGFVPFDGERPRDAAGALKRAVVDSGAKAEDIVAGCHCLAPKWIENQIEKSRENLGLETIDVYYLHNPETQLDEVSPAVLSRRLRAAFEVLEQAVQSGKIAHYGVATRDALRVPPSHRAYLSLEKLAGLAAEVAGGPGHHFRFVQLPFNLAMPEALTVQAQTVEGETGPALLAAKALGMSTMASAPLLQSKLTRGLPAMMRETFKGLRTDAQRALQFARSAPTLDVALVGMKRADHLAEDLAVCEIQPAASATFMRLFGG